MEATRNKRKGEDEAQEEVEINARKITNLLKPFPKEHMFEILSHAVTKYPDLLEYTEKVAENNPAHRTLLVSGIGRNTTSENLKSIFSLYGELEECKVVMDEDIGRSKGYAIVTYKRLEGSQQALKVPCKRIDARYTLCQVCCEEKKPAEPVIERMISVRKVPCDVHAERLFMFFSKYGEIEAGPIRFDKKTPNAIFIYVTVEGARKALVHRLKNIGGHYMDCSMASGDCSVDSSEVAPVNATNLTMPYGVSVLGDNTQFLNMNSQKIDANLSTQGGVGSYQCGINDPQNKESDLLQSLNWEPRHVRPQFGPQIGHSKNQHSTMHSWITWSKLHSFHNQQTGMNASSSSPHFPDTDLSLGLLSIPQHDSPDVEHSAESSSCSSSSV